MKWYELSKKEQYEEMVGEFAIDEDDKQVEGTMERLRYEMSMEQCKEVKARILAREATDQFTQLSDFRFVQPTFKNDGKWYGYDGQSDLLFIPETESTGIMNYEPHEAFDGECYVKGNQLVMLGQMFREIGVELEATYADHSTCGNVKYRIK